MMIFSEARLSFVFLALFYGIGIAQPDSESVNPMCLSLDALLNLQVETVSRVAEAIEESPGTVYVFTAETIRRRGYNSLADLLRHVPGFAVFHKDLQHIAVVRGLASNDNEKFTLLINGVEVNQAYEPDILDGPINLENAELVEVVVGPSSLFEPANTLVATINIITKKTDGTEIITSAGSERLGALTLTSGKSFSDERNVTVSASIEKRAGWDAWDETRSVSSMNNNAGRNTTRESHDLDHFVTATAQFDDWSFLFVSRRNAFTELRLYNPNATPPSLHPVYEDQLHGGSMRYETDLSETQTVFAELSSFYKETTRTSDIVVDSSNAQWDHGAEIGYILNLEKHLIQAGIQGIYEDNFNNYRKPELIKETFFYADTYGVGVYLSETYSPTKRLRLLAGVRADHNTLVGNDVHWGGRAGASYKVTEGWVSKFFFNRSVRMPSPLAALNEIWGIDAPNAPVWASLSTTAERPEILSTLELANTLTYSRGRLVATIYYQMLKDFISWGAPHTNVGDYSGWGAELSGEHWFSEALTAWANASYINSSFEYAPNFGTFVDSDDTHAVMDDKNRLIGAPIYTVNAGMDWMLITDVHFSPALSYFGEQPYLKTDGNFAEVDHRVYLNAALLFDNFLHDGWDFRLSGKNLLDNRDYVGVVWSGGEYRPRGASVEVSMRMVF